MHRYSDTDDVDQKARALFPYEGGEADQLPFLEGDELTIVDSSESDWWKTEKAGVIFIVPAAFLELIGEPFLQYHSCLPALHLSAPRA